MNFWRYEVSERIEIAAPVQKVYTLASDPSIVPQYVSEVLRIDILERESDTRAVVRSHLKIAGLTVSFRYRYHYRRPTNYSGVQEGRRLLRGYFSFRFNESNNGTSVIHTEGLISAIPLLAPVAGFIYYRLLSRGGLRDELGQLKSLVEAGN